MTTNFDTSLQRENLSNIRQRLSRHTETIDLAQIIPSRVQGVFVRTIDDVMELYCYEPKTRNLSDIMSRIGLKDPLNLLAAYSQVMFLTNVWQQSSPERIYIAGFGGGRLAMAYHHYNQNVLIDGSDFDPAIIDVAHTHFGIEYDERYSINAADSAEDLDSRNAFYDIIIIDVFSNSGQHPLHLSSRKFFEKCRRKLSPNGVLAINLIERDPERIQKISNLAEVFPAIVEWRHQGSHIVFAAKTDINRKALIKRATEFEQNAVLNYPFSDHAKALKEVDRNDYKFG